MVVQRVGQVAVVWVYLRAVWLGAERAAFRNGQMAAREAVRRGGWTAVGWAG